MDYQLLIVLFIIGIFAVVFGIAYLIRLWKKKTFINIRSQDILQINATLLAGLLILLSLHSINPLAPYSDEHNQILTKQTQINDTMDMLKNLLSSYHYSELNFTNTSSKHVPLLDEKVLEEKEAEIQYHQISTKLDNFNKTFTVINFISSSLDLQDADMATSLMMIIPFSFSAIVELSYSLFRKDNSSNASTLGITSLISAFILLAIALYIKFEIPIWFPYYPTT